MYWRVSSAILTLSLELHVHGVCDALKAPTEPVSVQERVV